MRIMTILVLLAFLAAAGCSAGYSHVGFKAEGKTKSDLIKEFGYPTRVEKGAEGTETWIYPAHTDFYSSSGAQQKKFYYIVGSDGRVIKQGYGVP